MRPAKPPDCAMPVLDIMPLADHQQIALVDAWGDLAAKDEDLLTYLKREGCQVGADAVVLTSKHTQHEGDLVGWGRTRPLWQHRTRLGGGARGRRAPRH